MGLDIRTLTTKWSRKQLDDTNHNFKQLKENIGTVDENAVGSEQLKEDSVGTLELKDKAVTGDKIGDKAVGTDNLKENSVGSEELKDGAVKKGKIDEDAIDGLSNIIDDTIPLSTFTPEIRENLAEYTKKKLNIIAGWYSYATSSIDKWTPNTVYGSVVADCIEGELWSANCTIKDSGMSKVIFWKNGKIHSDLDRGVIGNHRDFKFKIPDGVNQVSTTSNVLNGGLEPTLKKFSPVSVPLLKSDVIDIKDDLLVYEPVDLEIHKGFLTYASSNVTMITQNDTYRTIVSKCEGNEQWSIDTAVNDSTTSAAIFWDVNGKYIGDLDRGAGKLFKNYKVTTPSTAKYISTTSLTAGLMPILRKAQTGKLSLMNERLSKLELTSTKKTRIIVNFGDSIFGNKRPPKDISTIIQNYLGDIVINLGFGGCMMSKRFERSDNAQKQWDAWSMHAISKSIKDRDFSVQLEALAPGNTLPGYFREAYNILISIDWDKIDICTIEYGTNDYTYTDGGQFLQLNNPDDLYDLHSYAGSLRYSLENLWSRNSNMQILLISPTYRFWLNDDLSFLEDSDTKVIGGKKLYDFCKTMKDVSDEYKIPYFDSYINLGINKHSRESFYEGKDGTHPARNGDILMGIRWAKFIEKNTW